MGYSIISQAIRPDYATAADFAAWRERAKTLSYDQLAYVIRDCREAEQAMRGHNPDREGYYSDQAATYYDELRSRGLQARYSMAGDTP
jgi:hypothetical protein